MIFFNNNIIINIWAIDSISIFDQVVFDMCICITCITDPPSTLKLFFL